MGTIAARDCLRVLQLTEQVASALLITVRQAVLLRIEQRQLSRDQIAPEARAFFDALGEDIAFIDEDHPLESTLRNLTDRVQSRHWSLYGSEEGQ